MMVGLWWTVVLFIPTAILLTVGGFRDLIKFFKHLEKMKQNAFDNGMVIDHHNLVDEAIVSELDNELNTENLKP